MRELSRGTVTVASQVMLPTYVLGFTWFGGWYVVTPPADVQESPALRYIDSYVVPLNLWGLVFLSVAAVIACALLSGSRMACLYALILGGLLMAVCLVAFASAAIWGDALGSAAGWPFMVMMACYASYRSVLKGEV